MLGQIVKDTSASAGRVQARRLCVDSDHRVFEIDGLRVADASVMPSIVRGNTNAAVIAIAGKAADIVPESIRSMIVPSANRSHRKAQPE